MAELRYSLLSMLVILSACTATPVRPPVTPTPIPTVPKQAAQETETAESQPEGEVQEEDTLAQDEHADCGGIRMLLAHRGDSQHAENTLAAVLATMDTGFDGAEIDVQVLNDHSTWVLHHDLLPGRVVEGLPHHALINVSPAQWHSAHITAQASAGDEKPTSLEDLLGELASGVPTGWTLAIEIKWYWDADAIRNLVTTVARYLPDEAYFFTSLDERALQEVRAAGYSGYLGWVVLHPAVLSRSLSSEERNYIGTYGWRLGFGLDRVSTVLEGGKRLQEETELPASFTAIAAPVGVHVEREMLTNSALVDRLKNAGAPVFTYAADGKDLRHAHYLGRRIRETKLTPTGAVLSMPRAEFCDELARIHGEDVSQHKPFEAAPLPQSGGGRVAIPLDAPFRGPHKPVDLDFRKPELEREATDRSN